MRLAIYLLLACLTALAYAGVAGLGFVGLDDHVYVTGNDRVTAGLTWEGLRYAFTSTEGGSWHPLTWLSHMGTVEAFGLAAGPHHGVNLLLHLASALLLLRFLDLATGAPWRSGMVAALFALHPLHVESVAWIAERKDVLSALFFMLTLCAWVRYTRRPGRMQYAAVLLLFATGLMCKPMGVTLPCVLLLLDFWPLGRIDGAAAVPRLLLEKLPLLAVALAFAVLTLLSQGSEGNVGALERYPLSSRLANATLSQGIYLGESLWPARLAVFHPYPESFPVGLVAAVALLLVAVSWLAVRHARRLPFVFVGWFWWIGMLVPVIGLVQVGSQAHADRYTYLPHVGLFLAVTWSIWELARPARVRQLVAALGAVAILGACVMATRAQVRVWRDDLTLFGHALAVTSDNYLAHRVLGRALRDRGRIEEATLHYREFARIKPQYAMAHDELGTLLRQGGDLAGARASFERALEVDPRLASAHNNLAALLATQGRCDQAIGHLAESLEIDPNSPAAHANIAACYLQLGSHARAAQHFRRALELEPDLAPARRSLERILEAHPEL